MFTGWGTIVNDQFVPYNTKPGAIFESLEDIILVQSWAQVYVKFDLRDGFYDTGHVVSATETEETEFISELNNTRIVAERAIYTIKDIPANWSTIFDGTKILMYAGDNFGDLPSVYKDDHDLLGWKFLDGTFALSNTHVPTDDDAGVGEIGEVQLYADWIFAEHPEKWRFITFDANGGRIDAYRSVSVSTSVVSEYDEETDEFKYVTKLILDITNSNPQWDISESRSQTTKKYYVGRLADIMPYSVNAGYSFAGWWTAKDGGELIESSSTIVDTATVYAHWQKVDEDYSINQQTLIIVAIIVVVIVIGAIVIFLLKKSFIGSRKVITINEKFIENFNKDNIKEKPDLEDINNKIDDSSTKQ